jgi:hypothetical protein
LPPIRIRSPRLEPGWFWGVLDIVFRFWAFLVAQYESYLIIPSVSYHVFGLPNIRQIKLGIKVD